jgi:hypothetical protein
MFFFLLNAEGFMHRLRHATGHRNGQTVGERSAHHNTPTKHPPLSKEEKKRT